MKKILLPAFILLTFKIYSQNIVTNPSFEDTISCPTGGSQINTTSNWFAYRWSPDYFNSCAIDQPGGVSVPSNGYGNQLAATGNAYSGFFTYGTNAGDTVLREYLGAQLTNSLSIGQKYYVSLKVNMSNNLNFNCRTNNIGVLFSTISYKNPLDDNLNTTNPAPVKNFAHVYTTTVISDTVNWVTISGSFVADSTYNYIIVGNLFDNHLTSHVKIDAAPYCKAYYFVDDICVSTDSMTCMEGTGINEQHQQLAQLSIFPNPSNETFNISLPHQQAFNLQVNDVAGRIIYTHENATGIVTIDCNSFSSGVYFVKAVNERMVLTGKLFKD